MKLELEPFNNFSKLVVIVSLLLALSSVIANKYKKQGNQVFSTKNYVKIIKKNSYLIRQIVIYKHFMQHFLHVCTSMRSMQLFNNKKTFMKVQHVINPMNRYPNKCKMICSSLSIYCERHFLNWLKQLSHFYLFHHQIFSEMSHHNVFPLRKDISHCAK